MPCISMDFCIAFVDCICLITAIPYAQLANSFFTVCRFPFMLLYTLPLYAT